MGTGTEVIRWCESVACTYHFLMAWQTLVAGLTVLIAALLTLVPIYRQLHMARLQIAISTREVLINRLETTERRASEISVALHSMTGNFLMTIYQNGEEGEPTIKSGWAFGAQQDVAGLVADLTNRQASQADTQAIDDHRAVVIKRATSLMLCLDAVHRLDSTNFLDSDLGYNDEEARIAEAKAEAESKVASAALDSNIQALQSAAVELDIAFEAHVACLRNRIRQINDLVDQRSPWTETPVGQKRAMKKKPPPARQEQPQSGFVGCTMCLNVGWVCAQHRDRPRAVNSNKPGTCDCDDADMPCPVCNAGATRG
jgi:hypothetical protein